MNFEESFTWLENNGYFDFKKDTLRMFKRILKQTIKPKHEEMLVLGDTGHENFRLSTKLSAYYFLASEKMGVDSKVLLQTPKEKGESTNPEIINALAAHKTENIVIANLSNKFGSLKDLGSSFRSFCKQQDHRFISTTSLGFITNDMEDLFIRTLNIDYKSLAKKHAKLKEIFDEGESARVTTEAGTDLKVGIKGVTSISADGLYNKPGTGGNLPSGEVYLPPAKKQVDGKIVIDGSSRNIDRTELIQKPFTISVKNGEIFKIEGEGSGAQNLLNSIKWAKQTAKHDWGVKRIGELGIGLNPNAKLIGSTIIDEKVLGTAHIAVGSNHWFGGTIYSIIHLDQVFKNPILEVDGNEININKL